MKLRNCFKFCMVLVVFVMISGFTVTAKAVTIDGKNWRQLTETVNISWDDLDEIYDTSTGETNTTVTNIGSVEFAGWTWASIADIASMFSSFTDLTIGTHVHIFETNSIWAPEVFTKFTQLNSSTTAKYLEGWSRSKSGTNVMKAAIQDTIDELSLDRAYTNIVTSQPTYGASYRGAFMYQELSNIPEPVPEPATIALLGIGLVGLASAEVRRRRKKRAVDKS